MKDRAINKYCSKVKHLLLCTRERKLQIINGLKAELQEKNLADSITFNDLCVQIGMPEETAAEFQYDVPYIEYAKARIRSLRIRRFFIILTIVFAVLYIHLMFFFKHHIETEAKYEIITIESLDEIEEYEGN